MNRQSRRQFLRVAAGLGLSVAGLALAAGCGSLAPPPARTPRIGVLGFGRGGTGQFYEAFRQGLRELGYVDGKVDVLFRPGGIDERPEAVVELLAREPDVVLAADTQAALVIKNATSAIPIVFAAAGDPVGAGLVASIARPGGNATGLTTLSPQLSAKRLELLKEVVPGLSRVGVLSNPDDPDKRVDFQETERAAKVFGIQVQPLEVRSPGDFNRAFEAVTSGRPEALITLGDSLIVEYRAVVVSFASRAQLPTMYDTRIYVEPSGGLMAYAPSAVDLWRRAATYVDKILKGAKPADLPVEQPRTFELVINLKTAQALGLTLPQSVLLQTTEVIE